MLTLEQVRQKYPGTKGLSDNELAKTLHETFYSEVPEVQFYQKLGIKPPVQWGQIKEDIERIPGNIAGNVYDFAAGIPGAIAGGSEAIGQAEQAPGRAAKSLGRGAINSFAEISNLGPYVGEYAKSRGLTKGNIYGKPQEIGDVAGNLGALSIKANENPTPSDEFLERVGGLIPLLTGSGALTKAGVKGFTSLAAPMAIEAASQGQDPVAAAATPYAIGKTAKAVTGSTKYVANKASELNKSRKASGAIPDIEEKVTGASESLVESRRGKDLVEQARKDQEQAIQESKERFANKIVERLEPVEESLARTEKHVTDLITPEISESKGALAGSIQGAQKGLHKKSSKNYEPFNEEGPVGSRAISEENVLTEKAPKEIEGTKTFGTYNEVTKNAALSRQIDSIKSKIENKKLELKDQSDLEGYTKVKGEINALNEKLSKKVEEHGKTHAPTVSDYRKIYQEAGGDIAEINYQFKYNKTLGTAERDALRAQKQGLETVQGKVLDKMKSSMSPEEFAKLSEANKFHQNMILPFRNSPLLRSATEGTGTVVNNDFFKKASTLKDRELVQHLLANPKVKQSATAHDIRGLNIKSKEAIQQYLRERGKHLTDETKNMLEERVKSFEAAEDMDALRKSIKQTDVDLKSNAPHIAEVLKKHKELRGSFEDLATQKRIEQQMRSHLRKFDMTESEINYEMSKYRAHLKKLEADAKMYETFKDRAKSVAKVSVIGGLSTLGLGSLFGGKK